MALAIIRGDMYAESDTISHDLDFMNFMGPSQASPPSFYLPYDNLKDLADR
jgi:hypothetical protein